MRTWVLPEGKGGTEGCRSSSSEVGMWYEILPSLGVMYVCLCIPGMATTFFHKLENGGKPKRIIRTRHHWTMMERDRMVSGNNCHFNAKGLENID